jgi:hypothetical protein
MAAYHRHRGAPLHSSSPLRQPPWTLGISCEGRLEDDLRCEWGLDGLLSLIPTRDAVVIVDVLSFSTAVDIAVANGVSVLPHSWKMIPPDICRSKARATCFGPLCSRSVFAFTCFSSVDRRTHHTGLALAEWKYPLSEYEGYPDVHCLSSKRLGGRKAHL